MGIRDGLGIEGGTEVVYFIIQMSDGGMLGKGEFQGVGRCVT